MKELEDLKVGDKVIVGGVYIHNRKPSGKSHQEIHSRRKCKI